MPCCGGDATLALSTAREVTRLDASDGAFEVAEVLQDLGRSAEAARELERLRADGEINTQEIDRRLALLAYDNGDLEQAQKRFTALMRTGEVGDGAMFYLAQIAESQGDKDAALAIYRRLIDSSMAAQARVAAAGLLLDLGKRAEAFALVDDLAAHDAHSTFDLVVQKSHLLADHGDTDGALALLSAAAESYPHHPTLEYERATMLERAGQTRESVQAFEVLLATRPNDPTVLNALGYTLADHRQQLPRAEQLIRQALLATPDSPAALDSLGWVRLRRGDSRDAAGILERAYTVRTGSRHRGSLGRSAVEQRFAIPGPQGAERCAGAAPPIPRHSRQRGNDWCRVPGTADMGVRGVVVARARLLRLLPWFAVALWLAGCQTAPKSRCAVHRPRAGHRRLARASYAAADARSIHGAGAYRPSSRAPMVSPVTCAGSRMGRAAP